MLLPDIQHNYTGGGAADDVYNDVSLVCILVSADVAEPVACDVAALDAVVVLAEPVDAENLPVPVALAVMVVQVVGVVQKY